MHEYKIRYIDRDDRNEVKEHIEFGVNTGHAIEKFHWFTGNVDIIKITMIRNERLEQ